MLSGHGSLNGTRLAIGVLKPKPGPAILAFASWRDFGLYLIQ
jgi:hypothetical protein